MPSSAQAAQTPSERLPSSIHDPSPLNGFRAVRELARPDEWASNARLRVDGHPFRLEGREYIRQVIRDTSDEIVIPKAAQMAFTITFLVRSLHWITQRKWHHLYLLPLKTGARTFVQARIDPIIESQDILDKNFATVDNTLHKQSSDRINLYIRGTNISRELQEIPVDVEVWDERDKMVEDNLEDARHRMDGSDVKKLTILSVPTVQGHGVDSEDAWHASDQHRWEIPCPGCSRYQVLSPEESLRLGDTSEDSVLECLYCRRRFRDEERASLNASGRWVPYNLEGNIRGYHISQFNSPTMPLYKIVEDYFRGQKDARKLRSYYNQSLGVPYTAPGDRLTPEILDAARTPGAHLGGIPDGPVFVGIDIGTMIHLLAYTMTRNGHQRLWQMHLFREWSQVDEFLSRLGAFVAVVDAQPEKRAARDLCLKYHGKVWLGFEDDRPQAGEIANFRPLKVGEAGRVNIDRTMAFDQVIKDFMDGIVVWPPDARELGEYLARRDHNGLYHHMIQMVRVEEENARGQIVARWRKNRNPDHWHHAQMFSRIAMMRTPTLQVPAGISAAFNKAGSLVSS